MFEHGIFRRMEEKHEMKTRVLKKGENVEIRKSWKMKNVLLKIL
jgi:hypothetical protein